MDTVVRMPEFTPTHDPRIVPTPPRLHWGWVLALSVITRSYFNSIWMIVQANWVRKVTGRQDAFWWAIANVCVLPVIFLVAIMVGATVAIISHGQSAQSGNDVGLAVGAFAVIAILGCYTTAAFKLRSALQEATVGLAFGPVMTFLFSGTYFQYFLYDYVVPDAAEQYGPLAPPPSYVSLPTTRKSGD